MAHGAKAMKLVTRNSAVALAVAAVAACSSSTEVVGFVANSSTAAGGSDQPSGGTGPVGSAGTGTSTSSAGSGVTPNGGTGTVVNGGSGGASTGASGSSSVGMGGTGDTSTGGAGGSNPAGGAGGSMPNGPINILVWNYTTGYGHQSRETAIPVLQTAAQGTEINFDVTYALTAVEPEGPSDADNIKNNLPGTKPVNTSAFVDGGLDKYDIVYFLNTTGSPLSGDGSDMEKVHEQALRDFIEKKGKSFIGTHSATDTYQNNAWPWYVNDLVGANFTTHSNAGTTGSARWNDNVKHAILTSGMVPNPWQRAEEWYNFSRDVRQYTPTDGSGAFTVLLLANDNQFPERPTAWVKEFPGGGRMFYTAFGHDVSAFKEPAFQKFFFAGIRWAAHRL